ncbi:serine/threonine protein kinase [Streptosporangiaceae bacterium NEAU-GS5]|nr:serine/threonine protein kinase [Streptosporangiaceae bacterium NEAU-GS5]
MTSRDPSRLGPYELIERLGEGGQGTVFRGRGAAGEDVAVKLLHARLTGDPEARERFLREVALAQRVARFCTAPVLSADLAGNQPYIVSEYVPGPSLRQLVEREGPRRGAALDRIAIATATALAAIHRAGITHRDFKPANVLMGPEGPVVIDFGVARALDSPQSTITGATMGTPSYLAPELLSGGQATSAADVFAWGVTMTFAASGRPAFGADSIPTVMNRILNAEPDLGPLAPPLRELVADCLIKDPSLRPTAEDLVAHLTGQPTYPVRRLGPSATGSMRITGTGLAAASGRGGDGKGGDGPTRTGRRKRGPLIAAAAAVLALVGGATAAIISFPSGGDARGTQAASLPAAQRPSAPPSSGPALSPSRTPKVARSPKPTPPRTVRTTAKPAVVVTAKPTQKASVKPSPSASPKPSPSPSPTPTPNPYTPASVCGANFKIVDSHAWGDGAATTYLMRNAAGKKCVVTLGRYVKSAEMGAVLRVKGAATGRDFGTTTYYAGPIRLAAAGKCVIWGGGYAGASWTSAWSHCG